MDHATRLSVNIDHVATLREARGVGYPDPLAAARLAESAGAEGITIHLRQDRRHIQDADLTTLRNAVQGKLNLEISTRPEMIAIAVACRPHQVTLVPERPDEVTTEGGLDLGAQLDAVRAAAQTLASAAIGVSVFLDPSIRQVERLADLGRDLVPGFEINTDAYSRAGTNEVAHELDQIRRAAKRGEELGLRVFAGHGLTSGNVGPVSRLPQVEELNIGHSVVSRAVLVGMDAAVRELLQAMHA